MDFRVLEVANLQVQNNDHTPLGPFNFTLAPGEVLAVLGAPLTGKSELLQALAEAPERLSGTVKVCGHNIGSPEAKRLFGYVPSGFALYEELTCREYLGLFAEAYKVDRHYRPYMISEALSLTHLTNYADAVIEELSETSLRRRLSLARALVHDPRLLIIDDYLLGLEPSQRHLMLEVLNDIRNTGKTLIISANELKAYGSIVSQVLLLQHDHPAIFDRPTGLALAKCRYMQIQLLDAQSTLLCQQELTNSPLCGDLLQSCSDPGVVRFMYSGTEEQLQTFISQLVAQSCRIISCFEIAAFFGRSN